MSFGFLILCRYYARIDDKVRMLSTHTSFLRHLIYMHRISEFMIQGTIMSLMKHFYGETMKKEKPIS
jgi:hypothetical protein